ncbi:hydroxymethylglutaryl-CoA reductase, degradative [Mariniluteicoccus endophyticus]
MANSRISGMRNLDISQRRAAISEALGTTPHWPLIDPDALSVDQASNMSENTVGLFSLPVGICTNVTLNGHDRLVPMVTEEASVVAAASNAARIARVRGGFTASSSAPLMQAQIQLVGCPTPEAARADVLAMRDEVVAAANACDRRLVELGGGVRDLTARVVRFREKAYVVVHLVVDVRDAMGANAVNTMAERVAPLLAQRTGGRPLLRILTNKADQRLARATCVLDKEALGGEQVVTDMLHAYAFAAADPYRAATHNKGIMNGISAVVLATGNDTRAVEAGCHSHAIGADGRYTTMSHFEQNADGHLVGTLELPMPVGLVGGATKTHPGARWALEVLGVESASELAQVIVAVGLAQNVAAMRALATEGIQRGHMSLHAKNIAIAAGAPAARVADVADRMVAEGSVTFDRAVAILAEGDGHE